MAVYATANLSDLRHHYMGAIWAIAGNECNYRFAWRPLMFSIRKTGVRSDALNFETFAPGRKQTLFVEDFG